MEAQQTKLGRIVSVSGSQVIVLLEGDKGNGHEPPTPEAQIGSLVKMETGRTTVFGLISGLSIPIPAQENGQTEMHIVQLDLIGESVNGANGVGPAFSRGVSIFPALGCDVFASTEEDLGRVYARPESVSTVPVGTIHQNPSLPAFVITDDLLGKHFAVLGTTGTGKSCAIALILRALLSKHANSHILLLDLHAEYASAFGDAAEVLDTDSLQLPYWLLNFDELAELVIGDRESGREVEEAILGEVILAAKRQFLNDSGDSEVVTVDTPVPFRLGEVAKLLDDAMGKLEKPENSAPYLRLKSRIKALQTDRRYSFMFPGLSVHDNMAAILSQIFRIPVGGKPITIMDLSGVPSEVLNVVISLLCRMTFDFAQWSDRSVPILLVCEEAHRYAPENPNVGFEPTKRALARISKEGRKYGVSLALVSQRPSELSSNILSQCNTIFALRMSNIKDHEFVRGALSESGIGLLDCLPLLRTAEAVVVGEGVSVPMRICFTQLSDDNRPLSSTASFSAAWDDSSCKDNFVEKVVARWRHQI